MPDVTAVIGTFECASLLPECIGSLRAQTVPPREVIVVDAGSTDDTVDVARSLGATVVVTRNLGLGHLYNQGAANASSEFVFVANPDTAFDERCLELLASALTADDSLFAADPRQVSWDDGQTIHARQVMRRGTFRDPIPWHHVETVLEAEVSPTVTANAGGMLVRLDRFRELGGFDEGYPLDYEDFDLCLRAAQRGWGCVYVPDAVMRHAVGGATPRSARARRRVASHVGILRLALTHFAPRSAALVIAGELMRLVRHPRVVGPAFVRTMRALPTIVRARRQLRA